MITQPAPSTNEFPEEKKIKNRASTSSTTRKTRSERQAEEEEERECEIA
jgi:hypothetical protein